MASQLASGNLISDRYASALYDLATEKKVVDPVINDLSNLKKILNDNKELSLVIKSPLFLHLKNLTSLIVYFKKLKQMNLQLHF